LLSLLEKNHTLKTTLNPVLRIMHLYEETLGIFRIK
jgi:hypothetical protein